MSSRKKKLSVAEHKERLAQIKKENEAKILNAVSDFIRGNKKLPTRSDLNDMGITKDIYRNHFVTLEKMYKGAFELHPDLSDYVITETLFNQDTVKKTQDAVKNFKRFVVTTAVTGMPVNQAFYDTITTYCDINNASLLVLPTVDPASSGGFSLDGKLKDDNIVITDTVLNQNLYISTFKTSAKQINTLTGLRRVGDRERSMIVASPKQFLEYVPISNNDASHALMTTGAITDASYLNTDAYMSLRTAWLADKDHQLGAVIVEIVNDKEFHFRQIQANPSTGSFTDLGIEYSVGACKRVKPDAIVLGDIHVGSIDRNVYKSTNKILRKLKPKRVFFHDLFDGASCNPHASAQYLTKAKLKDKLSIEKELRIVASYLKRMQEKHPYVEEFIVVRSNHDLFLDRYLDSGDYIKDSTNSEVCHILALAKLDGQMPLEAGLRLVDAELSRVTFLELDETYKLHGLELGQHGHLGMNGQRNPANASLEIAYGKGVFGHSHTAGILRGIYRVGTSTRYRMGYNHGASSWTHTLCVVNPDGTRQLINDIDGKWRMEDE